jgi:hypothetical protein
VGDHTEVVDGDVTEARAARLMPVLEMGGSLSACTVGVLGMFVVASVVVSVDKGSRGMSVRWLGCCLPAVGGCWKGCTSANAQETLECYRCFVDLRIHDPLIWTQLFYVHVVSTAFWWRKISYCSR